MRREPDRLEKQAEEIVDRLNAGLEGYDQEAIAKALRATEQSALERAAAAFAEAPTTQHSGAAVASVLRYLARDSAPKPAAAPAAETRWSGPVCDTVHVHTAGQGCFNKPAPPSEPVAPAPDLRALLREAWGHLQAEHAEHLAIARPYDPGIDCETCTLLRRIDAALADDGKT